VEEIIDEIKQKEEEKGKKKIMDEYNKEEKKYLNRYDIKENKEVNNDINLNDNVMNKYPESGRILKNKIKKT